MQHTQDDLNAGPKHAVEIDRTGNSPAAEAAAGAPSDDSAQELDEDQQRAFESIIAQIDSDGDSQPVDESDADIAFGTITVADDTAPIPGDSDSETGEDGGAAEGDSEAQDISADIDDLLKQIASSDGTTAPDPADAEADNAKADEVRQPPDPEPPSGVAADDRLGTADTAGHSDGAGKEPEAPPSKPAHPANVPPVVARQPTVPAGPSPRTAPLSGNTGKKVCCAAAAAAVALLLTGGWYWFYPDRMPAPAASDTARPSAVALPSAEPAAPAALDPVPSAASPLAAVTAGLDRLRQQLLEKSEAIEQLRNYYRAGIEAETDLVIQLLRDTDQPAGAHAGTLENPRVHLALTAIQRRTTTIDKLDAPRQTLHSGSEELLFLSRRADLLALMTGKTSDIDVDGFVQLADERMADHREMLAQLNIDVAAASPVTLASIWQGIEQRLAAANASLRSPAEPPPEKVDDAAIWKEICAGDFSRKHLLTRLPPQVAQCLSTWTGKDLFLNGLTELSPASARLLAAWGGDWLGLNALAELSPEAARHLSQWRGKGLSLNGLSELSPPVAAILSQWQGEQIELVNLTHTIDWDNARTRLYLSENVTRDIHAARK